MAARYEKQMGLFERFVLGRARQWAVAQAEGAVLEIAVGSGLNLPLYGSQVDHIVGVDLSEGMLDIARRKVARADTARIELRQGDAQALDLPDDSVDTVVSTFTFCTIPDPKLASEEAFRVLVPGGQFVLAEHGPSTNALGRALMRVVEPLSVRFGADHLTRNPVPYLVDAGFEIDQVERTGRGGIVFRVLAHKPGTAAG
ncbi:class I SAM-dependent methyltransferase [Rhodococcus sp. ABRD24]|nr:class I SAM-dependent methyltransferase [Rhodococcus sp. ABRD24]